jgi:hypothetical protein
MTTRYAYINLENNETLWGPGPNPYFITLKNGDMWEITAHTVQESEAIGIFIVEQKDKRDFDSRFERQLLPEYEIINGKPRETWSYEFIPAARTNMVFAVDEHAEGLRSTIATQYAGQYEEYNEAYREALEVSDLPVNAVIEPGTYPFLDADVDVTYSASLGRIVQNVKEAATLVIETRNAFKAFGISVRTNRLQAKKDIRDAATDAIAYHLYNQYIDQN